MTARLRLLAALSLALAAVPAAAAEAADRTSIPVRMTGSLTVTWAGDAQRGCAEAGVCGISGSATWHPGGRAELQLLDFGGSGEIHGILLLGFGGDGPVVRVDRRGGGGAGGSCADVGASRPTVLQGPVERGQLRLPIDAGGLDLSAGSCAGPRAADVAPALPSLVVPVRRALRRPVAIDLSGRRPFAAGAFSGEVVSTLRLRTGRAVSRDGDGAIEDEGDVEVRDEPPLAALALAYRVVGATGGVGIAFRGVPGPGCPPLDACGAEGSAEMTPGTGSTLVVYSTRVVRGRTTRARELRALRAGRTRAGGFAFLRAGTVAGTLRWADGSTCADRAPSPRVPVLLQSGRRSATLRLVPADFGYEGEAADPLRSRCPGPGAADALREGESLAVGRVPLAALGRRRVDAVVHAPPGPFDADGWSGEPRGTLTLELRLVRTRLFGGGRGAAAISRRPAGSERP
jgi:hypothetical protein